MAIPRFTRKQRLIIATGISFSFFMTELAVGVFTESFALVADAFHYFSDLIGVIIALVALMTSKQTEPAPQQYTFGWQRATLLGAFFNGVFLLALGTSILVQAVERCVHLNRMEKPELVLIVGCVGLALNVLVMSFLHEHDDCHSHDGNCKTQGSSSDDSSESGRIGTIDEITATNSQQSCRLPRTNHHHEHKHALVLPMSSGRDLGMLGVFIHVMGDAINNLGIIIAAAIIWKTKGENRYYADPAVAIFISIMILISSIPLIKNSGTILLQIAPGGIKPEDVKHDIEKIPGIESVHELHIWRLNQQKSIATAHIVVNDSTIESFAEKAKIIIECLHAYGIHSATLQPEISPGSAASRSTVQNIHAAVDESNLASQGPREQDQCQLVCGSLCGAMRCCTRP